MKIITVVTSEGTDDLIKAIKKLNPNEVILSTLVIKKDDLKSLKKTLSENFPKLTVKEADLYNWTF